MLSDLHSGILLIYHFLVKPLFECSSYYQQDYLNLQYLTCAIKYVFVNTIDFKFHYNWLYVNVHFKLLQNFQFPLFWKSFLWMSIVLCVNESSMKYGWIRNCKIEFETDIILLFLYLKHKNLHIIILISNIHHAEIKTHSFSHHTGLWKASYDNRFPKLKF